MLFKNNLHQTNWDNSDMFHITMSFVKNFKNYFIMWISARNRWSWLCESLSKQNNYQALKWIDEKCVDLKINRGRRKKLSYMKKILYQIGRFNLTMVEKPPGWVNQNSVSFNQHESRPCLFFDPRKIDWEWLKCPTNPPYSPDIAHTGCHLF